VSKEIRAGAADQKCRGFADAAATYREVGEIGIVSHHLRAAQIPILGQVPICVGETGFVISTTRIP